MSSLSSKQCYCNRARTPDALNVLCGGGCQRWFHDKCLTITNANAMLPYALNYQFTCKNCSNTSAESMAKKSPTHLQLCLTAIANLMLANPGVTQFSRLKEITPFIEEHWEALHSGCNPPTSAGKNRSKQQQLRDQIRKVLHREDTVFTYKEDEGDDQLFGLVDHNVLNLQPSIAPGGSVAGTKRRAATSGSGNESGGRGGGKQKVADFAAVKLSQYGYPIEYPLNKDGYDYVLAEPDPHSPHRTAWDESELTVGKAIPGFLYRVCVQPYCLLSLNDRAPQLKITEDRQTVTGDAGYSMVRSNHGIGYGGKWYYEVQVVEMPAPSAARIGFALDNASVQAPVGYERTSYSWRSRKGTVFTASRGKHFMDGRVGYGEGDIIGLLIDLPEKIDSSALQKIENFKSSTLVKFKSNLYYEVKERKRDPRPLPGSSISLYKNGESLGKAFIDLNEGVYYAAISLYKNATVKCNFGPDFLHPPKGVECRAFSELAGEAAAQQALLDVLYHVENEGKPPNF